MEIFARRAGVDMIHIPNKTGAAGMLNDLVVGDAQVAFINSASSAAMIKAGKLKPLAVVAEQRLPGYPDVPTMAEAGFQGRRHPALAEHAGAGGDAEAGDRHAVQGDRRGLEAAGAAGGVRQAARQHQARASRRTRRKTWLKGELDAWRKITSEVKIDLAE